MEDTFLLYGSDQPLPEQIELRAGPLTMLYEQGRLRRIRLGDQDVLQMIYAAVRDHNWGTILGELSDVRMEIGPDSFEIAYQSRHRRDAIDFSWDGTIVGTPDGVITFTFDGEAHAAFLRNRIGFCVLHGQHCAGQECEIEHTDGTLEKGVFPALISANQPFKDMRAITHELQDGLKARVSFEGDVFEMEDQRNWSDASYKTYCTPLERPYPARVDKGDWVRQTVRLELVGAARESAQAESGLPLVFSRSGEIARLPPIGLCYPSAAVALSEKQIERLRQLNLGHLRVDMRLSEHGAAGVFQEGNALAKALAVPLEVALFLSDDAGSELSKLAGWVEAQSARVVRFLVFHHKLKTTTSRWVELARSILGRFGAPVGAGTDAFFTEINRYRPPTDALDFVGYSMNPQMHAFDNLTLAENLAAQRETVKSARALSGGRPVVVGPVTFKMRWNPDEFAPPPSSLTGELPRNVDPRQMSLFGAGWTLGSLQALAESGASSLTYFETSGWLGVIENDSGSPLPDMFPSYAGGVFPVYHVFADVGEFSHSEVLLSQSSDPLKVNGLLLRNKDRRRLQLANLTERPQVVDCPDAVRSVTVKHLDASNVRQAMQTPEVFRVQPGQSLPNGEKGVRVELGPFALATLDWQEA